MNSFAVTVVSSSDILIRANDKSFSWTLGYDDLSCNQVVEVENELRFALKSVEKERSKRESDAADNLNSNPVSRRKKNQKEKRPIEQSLKSTAQGIRDGGPILATWLDSEKHRKSQLKSQLQSGLSRSFREIVKTGANLKPMTGKEYSRNRNETMLWLVYKHASLADALLVLYTFPTNELDIYTSEEITSIVEYVVQNRRLLYCEALEAEAIELILTSENGVNRGDFQECDAWRASSSPPNAFCNTIPVNLVDKETENHESGIQQVVLKRKRGSSVPESEDGFHSSSHEDVMTTSACSLSGLSPSLFATPVLSSDSIELLALIASLGGHMIPDVLFLRFRGEQKRWTVHGEIGVLTPSDAGFDPHLQRILSPLHFPALMDELAPCIGQVMPQATSNDVYYTIKSPLKEQLAHRITSDQRLIILAIRLICFVFPRERLWEPQFLSEARTLIPCLAHTLAHIRNVELPVGVKEAALQCILVKAGLEAACCQKDLLRAQRLFGDDNRLPQYLGAALAHRQSALARLNADYAASCAFIDNHLSNSTSDPQVDRRLHAWRLHLFVSRLKVLNLQERFDEAHRMIESWSMPHMLSLMERRVHIGYSLVASDIQRSLGRLKLSKTYLEDCCCHPGLLCNDSKRYQIICALVDVRCALGEIDEAESLVTEETAKLRSTDGLSKARRRLWVSSLDVNIARMSESSLAEARSKISDLTKFFSETPSLDISDQLLHVRTLTASARVYHLQSSFTLAIAEWEKVKTLAKEYSAFRERGFTFAFSQLSIGYAQVQIALRSIRHAFRERGFTFAFSQLSMGYAQVQIALRSMRHANSIFIEEKDNYWIPAITTEWLPKVRSDIAAWLQSK